MKEGQARASTDGLGRSIATTRTKTRRSADLSAHGYVVPVRLRPKSADEFLNAGSVRGAPSSHMTRTLLRDSACHMTNVVGPSCSMRGCALSLGLLLKSPRGPNRPGECGFGWPTLFRDLVGCGPSPPAGSSWSPPMPAPAWSAASVPCCRSHHGKVRTSCAKAAGGHPKSHWGCVKASLHSAREETDAL